MSSAAETMAGARKRAVAKLKAASKRARLLREESQGYEEPQAAERLLTARPAELVLPQEALRALQARVAWARPVRPEL
jgi:hypothetical protein